jgi:hypothetical protein
MSEERLPPGSARPDELCPLCGHTQVEPFHQDQVRCYVCCSRCRLVFVPSEFFLSADDEKAIYDYHENDPSDQGYRGFLSRLAEPMLNMLTPASCGLDFGSGPGPTLSVMFEEAGHRMAIYDPFYAPNAAVFDRTYDFISATEVVEHLHRPGPELDRLWKCLRPGGLLGLMTRQLREHEDFARWHYIKDPTHVAFYCDETWQWLAAKWDAGLVRPHPDVALFRKSAS